MQGDLSLVSVDRERDAGFDLAEIHLINAGDLGNDATDGGDGFTVSIHNRCWCMTVLLQAVKDIGADCGAFAAREDEDPSGKGLPLQIVTGFGDDASLGVHAAIEGNPHPADEGGPAGCAGEDGAAAERFAELQWVASHTTASKGSRLVLNLFFVAA